MKGSLFICLSVVLSVVLCQLECEELNISSIERELDGPVIQTLFADAENLQIYILTSQNSVYKSTDGGRSWYSQMSYMQDSSVVQPVYNESGVKKMYQTSIDGHVIFLGFGYQYWVTTGIEQSYSYHYETELQWIKFIPSPYKGDEILGIKTSATCLSDEACHDSLYFSSDWGETWSLVRNYVYKAQFADANSVYVISVEQDLQVGNQLSILDTWKQLYRIGTNGETKFKSNTGFIDFTTQNNILYAVQSANNTLFLQVSANLGDDFQKALFQSDSFPQDSSTYTFLDNSQGVSFIHFIRKNARKYGTLYEADTLDPQFWPSLETNSIILDSSEVEFSVFNGINGIYIANQYNTTILVDDSDIEKYLTTMISYNKGGVWNSLPVPSNSLCSSPDCSLHLDNVLTSLLTQQTAIGLMLAIGNEGTMKETHSDQLNLYLSRDAGFSWELVRSGPSEFTWGNYGGLFLSSSTSQSTNKVAFSWNQGLSWDACNFTSSNLEIDDIIQIGGPETLKFLLFGTSINGGSTKGSVTFLDFSNNISTQCAGENSPGETTSDFEEWTTNWNDNCLLGETTTYTRRRRDSICIVNSPPFAIGESESCECVMEDFTCDGICYKAQISNTGELTCEYICEEEQEDCGGDNPRGYKLVVGDTCSGGIVLDPAECPVETHSEFTVGWLSWVLLVLFFLLVIFSLVLMLIIGLYHTNDKVYQALEPHIPAWCTRDPSQEPDDMISYGDLDTNQGSLLDDDDLFN